MSRKNFKRVMIKVGGESLIGKREYGIDPKATVEMANQISARKD